MPASIAFIGAGPSTIYTVHTLMERAATPFVLTVFEAQAVAGRGTPYRPGWNDAAMLANIASIELPPLEETLIDWLGHQPADHLRLFGVEHRTLDKRAFYPRLLLGEYFKDQFEAILQRARAKGCEVNVQTRHRVVDALMEKDGILLSVRPQNGNLVRQRFDHVVIATGHQWPEEPEARPGYFTSPWPAAALAAIPPTRVGIRGSSLTAIDAAVAIAVEHGRFEGAGEDLGYRALEGTEKFGLTMMSRKGLLPEADFFHPIPYEPLTICTPDAMDGLIAEQGGDLLEEAFGLFKAELGAADPGYAADVDLAKLELPQFCDAFFANRIASDTFAWAEANLDEARRNFAKKETVRWRYAILRMHEVIERIVPHLDDEAFSRFSRWWKPVFVDEYATVPHESIERMLALHRAGKLSLLPLGDDYHIDSHAGKSGAVVYVGSETIHFSVFVEATGQRPLGAQDFPFPTLRRQGVIKDEPVSEGTPPRGIMIDEEFHPVADDVAPDRLFCLSLPFILGRHPFSQGITSCHEMGEVVGARLAAALRK